MEGDGYRYVLFANGQDNAASLTVLTPGAYAAPLGDCAVTFSAGRLTVALPPRFVLAVKITDTPEDGIYVQNIRRCGIANGTVRAKDGEKLALYKQYGSRWELLGLYKNGDTISAVTDGVYTIKVFDWDGLMPKEDVRQWKN